MSSDQEAFLSVIDGLKAEGNLHFQKGDVNTALSLYSTALQKLIESSAPSSPVEESEKISRQITLLSNRAMCHLQLYDHSNKDVSHLQPCIDDTHQALKLFSHSKDSSLGHVRSKLLYRRAKARYLLVASSSNTDPVGLTEGISLAIQDVMELLQMEPHNTQAIELMQNIQKLRGFIQDTNNNSLGDTSTPVGHALKHIHQLLSTSSMIDWSSVVPHLYSIMASISDDSSYVALELGRQGGIHPLLSMATHPPIPMSTLNLEDFKHKAQLTSWHILSTACSNSTFFQRFLIPIVVESTTPTYQILQHLTLSLLQLVETTTTTTTQEPFMEHWIIAAMGFLIRFILQLFQYTKEYTFTTTSSVVEVDVNPSWINPCSLCFAILSSPSIHTQDNVRLPLAVLDLLSTWTASDIDRVMEDSFTIDSSSFQRLNTTLSPEQIHAMKPKDIALYQQQLYQRKEEVKQRSKTNILYFCYSHGIAILISCATTTSSILLEQTCISTLSRLFSSFQEEQDWENILVPYLKPILVNPNSSSIGFEILHEEDESKQEEQQQDMMKRGLLTIALLQTSPDMGTWALSQGFLDELEECIQSQQGKGPRIASQVLSSAASMEKSRACISPLIRTEMVQSLLQSPDEDVASNIASTFAKLGLADAKLSSDEGEIMALLQVGTELLFQHKGPPDSYTSLSSSSSLANRHEKEASISTTTSPSVQRGIEILSYVATKTVAKDEIAHGYKGLSSQSVIERLVDLCTHIQSVGNSVDSYGIGTIFSSLVVSNETLRKEAFQGKDITAEQYEALQNLGKTEEEKEWEKNRVDVDPPRAVRDRIRKLAQKNVPRAMIHLLEQATDTTRDIVTTTLVRMAEEESVRGIMVQQGVLTACIQLFSEDHHGSAGRKRCRSAQHCIAKLLVTTNPTLLTSSQRMGSIKPLIHLVKDNDSSDLQQFEALLALTNLASVDDETKGKIVLEKGIHIFHLAMFSDHLMVRRAATEAMSNLLPHVEMFSHLKDPSHVKLWIAFSTDVQESMECSRAAIGCLAMASSGIDVAEALSQATHFEEMVTTLLQCGNLEIMHRLLVLLLNLTMLGSSFQQVVAKTGAYAFLERYIKSYQDDSQDLGMTQVEVSQLTTTVELAKEIIRNNI